MNRKLLTLTIAGAIALSSAAVLQAKDPGEEGGWHGKHGRGHGMEFKMERMTKNLDLTPQQQAQINPIMEQMKPQMRAIHEEAMKKADAVRDEAMTKIRAILTPEQQAKMDKMKEAHEKMREARKAMREARQQ